MGAAIGPVSAALAETTFTAAARFLMLKTLAPLLLLRRLGARGREILIVVVMRVVQPDAGGVEDGLVLVLLVDGRPSAVSIAWAILETGMLGQEKTGVSFQKLGKGPGLSSKLACLTIKLPRMLPGCRRPNGQWSTECYGVFRPATPLRKLFYLLDKYIVAKLLRDMYTGFVL